MPTCGSSSAISGVSGTTPRPHRCLADVLTSDSDRDVRMAAARGLGHMHDPAAIRALGTALDDTDPAMQYRAMVALQESTGKDYRHRPTAPTSIVGGST